MRLFACFLLLASLAADGAALPHSHAGSDIHEPAGHNARPHIHLWGHSHGHSSGHSHRDDAHCHDCPAQADHHAAAIAHDRDHVDLPVAWHSHPVGDHDQDAVYLNVGATIGLPPDGHAFVAAPAGGVAARDAASASATALPYTWAPPRYGAQVPIFLASTRLVI
ncbi:MAG: hypothetical protein AB7O59_19495 [Pirellulales bacterium]